jgi:hypothetical protein
LAGSAGGWAGSAMAVGACPACSVAVDCDIGFLTSIPYRVACSITCSGKPGGASRSNCDPVHGPADAAVLCSSRRAARSSQSST